MRKTAIILVLLTAALGLYGCSLKAQGENPPLPPPNPPNTPTAAAPKTEVKLDGKILLTKDKSVWNWSGGSSKRLVKDGSLQQASWSQDGKKIAYVKMEDDYSDIWVMGSSGNDAANLTRFGRAGADTWAFEPHWSPDGSQIAYLSDQSTYDLALWLMKPDGSGRKQVSIMNDYLGGIDGPTWHPKGDRLAFTAYRTGKPQVWSLTLANSRWQQLTDTTGGAYDPEWSPSGEALAFVAHENGKSDIWVIAMPDGAPQQVTRDGVSRSPVWSPDGKVLAYLSGQGGKFDIWAAAVEKTPEGVFRVGTPKRMTQGLGADPAGGLSWIK